MQFSMNSVQILALIATTACLAAPDSGNKQDNYKCMDTPRHKAMASPETTLNKMCSAYRGLSCCTNTTASRIDGDDLYKFQNVLCKKEDLSADCKKYFLQDACFFECSPDISRYSTLEDGLKGVPLCQSNCDNWFAACRNEFTCTKDWKKGMVGSFKCSSDDKCQTINDKFQNAKSFCEKVWANSYEVVADNEECMRFDQPAERNPSDWTGEDVQLQKTGTDDCQKNHTSSSSSVKYNIILLGIPFVMSYCFLQSKLV